MKKKIDWLEVFETTAAVFTCVTAVATAAAVMLTQVYNAREAHAERLKKLNPADSNNT